MQVTRSAAIALFTAMGFTGVDKWGKDKVLEKLKNIDTVMGELDEGTTLPNKLAKLVDDLKAAGEDIQVTGDAKAPAAAPAAPTQKKTAGGGKAAAPAAKKPADKPEPKPEKTGPAGVRASRSRPFLAGVLVKKYGRDAGVTEAMVAELDQVYGTENPTESLFCLRNAWHAIRGFNVKDTEKALAPAPAAE